MGWFIALFGCGGWRSVMSNDPYRRGVTSGEGPAGLENCFAICDALHNQGAIAQNSAGTDRIVTVCRRGYIWSWSPLQLQCF
jgi:hypothetical protein